MKERPILFSGPMVRALLDGRKTQTRRIVKGVGALKNAGRCVDGVAFFRDTKAADYDVDTDVITCPYGEPGDTLWVRETWCRRWDESAQQFDGYFYRADGHEVVHVDDHSRSPWRPSIHMPRVASRIALRVTSVHVERLQSITEEDALAEGIGALSHGGAEDVWLFDAGDTRDPRTAFSFLWDEINGERASWASNPWVWVVSFEVLV